jgi:hypothetical protein
MAAGPLKSPALLRTVTAPPKMSLDQMTLLALSDEEMDVLHRLAAPIAWGRRDEFMQAVANALASCPEPGPGVVYRTARELQRNFTLGVQRETAIAAAPRHLTPRASVQA